MTPHFTPLRTPPLLLGTALLFWGWQSGWWLVGALLAVVIESARVVGLRWELSEKDFRRLWDLTVFLFVAVSLYLFASNEGPGALAGFFGEASPATQGKLVQQAAQGLLTLFRWMPMVFFLMVAAQAYSTRDLIPWSVLSFVARRRRTRQETPPVPESGVNLAYPYFAVCLLAAGIHAETDHWFFVGVAGLLGWALWFQRSRRYAPVVWAGLLLLTLVAGFFIQRGFAEINNWANVRTATWLAGFMVGGTNPRESQTALGRIGYLKLSGKIMLRVEPKDNQPVPSLLREASYRTFRYPNWEGAGKASDFEHISGDTNLTWEFATRKPAQGAVTISQFLLGRGQDARRGLLAVPHGLVRLEKFGAFVVSTNPLGVVRVEEGPGLVRFDAYYTAGSTIDTGPSPKDLAVPTNDVALSEIVSQLNLSGQTTNEILRTVSAFFRDNFAYSTWLPGPGLSRTNTGALAHFLLRERKGHCEYFATAATLLLRKAGVPARYAVGYAVQERSGQKFVVRQRHAHAWCLAWMDGAWHDFDVTPGSWFEAEAQRASWTERLSDAGSRLWFEFSRLRWGLTEWRKYLLWLAGPALLVLLVRLFVGKQWKRLREQQKRRAAALELPGCDSEFYRLETELVKLGLQRPSNETLLDWLDRVQDHPLLAPLREPLDVILRLHYRYRFDPAGLGAAEREELRAGVLAGLERLRGGRSND